MRACWMTLMTIRELCINQIKRHTQPIQITWQRSYKWLLWHDQRRHKRSDRLPKTHCLLLIGWRKNKTKAKNFIGKLDFVWNVNLLKCAQCFCWSQNGRCKRSRFSMFIRFIYCSRFQSTFSFACMRDMVRTHTISIHPKNTIDNLKQTATGPKPSYKMMLIIPMVIQSMNIICSCNLCVHLCN